MSGCDDCKCGKSTDNSTCTAPAQGVKLDESGKCPCGKTLADCCHNDSFFGGDNKVLDKLFSEPEK